MTHTEILHRGNSDTEHEVSIFQVIASDASGDFSQPLPHCKTCGDPLRKDIMILDAKRRVPVICRCRSDELRREEEAEKEKNLRRRLDKFRAYSLMDERFATSTFENWKHRPDNQNLLDFGKRYCASWETVFANNRGLLLHGEAGNGKTYFSFAIANELYKQGKAVMAISVSRILAVIKDSYDQHGDMGETDVFNTIGEASLLILDDLGVEYKTNWAYEKLYAIIDTRYRANKPTIITTNLRIGEDGKGKKIDEIRDNLSIVDSKTRLTDPSNRIYNRLVEMCTFFEVTGQSWRTQKGEQNKAALYAELGLTGG